MSNYQVNQIKAIQNSCFLLNIYVNFKSFGNILQHSENKSTKSVGSGLSSLTLGKIRIISLQSIKTISFHFYNLKC